MTKYYQWHLQGGKEEKPVTIISFTVKSRRVTVNCQAEEGMTWGEFVNSAYNNDPRYQFYTNGSSVFCDIGTIDNNVNGVTTSDIIIPNHEYIFGASH